MNKRLAAFVLAALGAMAGWAEAQTGTPSHNQLLDAVERVETLVRRVQRKVDGIQVTIITSETVCTGAAAQCAGHTAAAASSTNHNPVAVIVFVTRNGEPVLSLPASAFTFMRKFTPASGPGYGPCNDAVAGSPPPGDTVGCGPFTDSLFQDFGDGLYAFYVHPTVAPFNWAAGKYTFMVKVTDANDLGHGLGTFVIP